jgi:2-isopropylmalate synthase
MGAKKVYIFDTTLRDGEQSPGVNLNIQEKLKIAQQLAKLNVDIIEAGFPIASSGDFEAVKAVADNVRQPVIAALARVAALDIDRAWEALKTAERPRIHTFIATSDIHLKHKLKISREEVLERIAFGVKYAKKYTDDVEFSPEDGFRTEIDFMCRIVETAIKAGATVINIPDTVGYAVPDEFGRFIREIMERVPSMDKAMLSVHCHNDLGLAVANSLAALANGAQQVEVAINGIGERAGNTALEEVVMALYTRKGLFSLDCSLNLQELYRTSRLVASLTGMPIQHNKAIVGKNAFTHEAGIHQDGVLKERTTYEIINPELIGLVQNNIVLGKHSGRHAFQSRLEELGFSLNKDELDKAFNRFKEMADKKQSISDKDLEAIIEDEIKVIPQRFLLEHIQISSGNRTVPTATLGILDRGKLIEDAACGDGPVDAVFKALDKLTGVAVCLKHYALNAVTGGKDAIGEVTVRVQFNADTYVGRGHSTDIIEASARAYLSAINKICYENDL